MTAPASKKLSLFERYLTLWVAGCMVAGVILGKALPDFVQTFRSWEFGEGSHINFPIAVLIWLMIIPMMMKVDFASVRNVGKRPKGLAVTLVNQRRGQRITRQIDHAATCKPPTPQRVR